MELAADNGTNREPEVWPDNQEPISCWYYICATFAPFLLLPSSREHQPQGNVICIARIRCICSGYFRRLYISRDLHMSVSTPADFQELH